MSSEMIYDDNVYVKRNKYASIILMGKCLSTLPFNVIGIYDPAFVPFFPWILFIEAFHHYHAGVFYLLAFHRNITQIYCSFFSNGVVQKTFLLLEALFDCGLVILYVHEYYRLHNINAFLSNHSIIHMIISILSFYSLLLSKRIKTTSLA